MTRAELLRLARYRCDVLVPKRRPFSADPMADIGDNRNQYNDRNRKQHDVSI